MKYVLYTEAGGQRYYVNGIASKHTCIQLNSDASMRMIFDADDAIQWFNFYRTFIPSLKIEKNN